MAIYDLFKDQKIQIQMFINGDNSISSMIKNKKTTIIDWLNQKERIFEILGSYNVVFIDSYLANYSFYEKISQIVNVPVYLDDTKRIDYPKGIILNWVINAHLLNYPRKKDIIYLLGLKYSILRKEFWKPKKKKIRKKVRTILITLGGSDLRNLTQKILKILCEVYPNIQKRVIVTKGFHNIKEIEKERDNKTLIICHPNASGMIKHMIESDIVISGCGQTLLELAFLGVPTIGIAISQNQIFNANNWKEIGFLEFAGFWDQKDLFEELIEKIDCLEDFKKRLEKREIGIRTINLSGKYKIFKCINTYIRKRI